MLREYLSKIADQFRTHLDTTEPINAQDFAGKVEDVAVRYNQLGFTSGREVGYNQGLEEGIEQGKQAEKDNFWDGFLDQITNSDYLFASQGWNDETFKPTRDVICKGSANYTFFKSQITDLKKLLETAGVTLDFSQATYLQNTFNSANVTRLPIIDASGTSTYGSSLSSTFVSARSLVEIEKFIVKEEHKYSKTFDNCIVLGKVIFDGTIGNNGLNLQWSPLTIESLRSIISCLKDYSTYTGSTVWKVTVGSTNLAKLTTEDLENIQAKGWQFV